MYHPDMLMQIILYNLAQTAWSSNTISVLLLSYIHPENEIPQYWGLDFTPTLYGPKFCVSIWWAWDPEYISKTMELLSLDFSLCYYLGVSNIKHSI